MVSAIGNFNVGGLLSRTRGCRQPQPKVFAVANYATESDCGKALQANVFVAERFHLPSFLNTNSDISASFKKI